MKIGTLPQLPDDMFESKDWKEARTYGERVEWLLFMYNAKKEDADLGWEAAVHWRDKYEGRG